MRGRVADQLAPAARVVVREQRRQRHLRRSPGRRNRPRGRRRRASSPRSTWCTKSALAGPIAARSKPSRIFSVCRKTGPWPQGPILNTVPAVIGRRWPAPRRSAASAPCRRRSARPCGGGRWSPSPRSCGRTGPSPRRRSPCTRRHRPPRSASRGRRRRPRPRSGCACQVSASRRVAEQLAWPSGTVAAGQVDRAGGRPFAV